jgi:hypothetical protein
MFAQISIQHTKVQKDEKESYVKSEATVSSLEDTASALPIVSLFITEA